MSFHGLGILYYVTILPLLHTKGFSGIDLFYFRAAYRLLPCHDGRFRDLQMIGDYHLRFALQSSTFDLASSLQLAWWNGVPQNSSSQALNHVLVLVSISCRGMLL